MEENRPDNDPIGLPHQFSFDILCMDDPYFFISAVSALLQIITKDDGVLFDLSSDDVIAGSITEFMVSGYMEKMKNNKMYLTTMSYNRNTFKVKFEA